MGYIIKEIDIQRKKQDGRPDRDHLVFLYNLKSGILKTEARSAKKRRREAPELWEYVELKKDDKLMHRSKMAAILAAIFKILF